MTALVYNIARPRKIPFNIFANFLFTLSILWTESHIVSAIPSCLNVLWKRNDACLWIKSRSLDAQGGVG
jgi:hypothetical protein